MSSLLILALCATVLAEDPTFVGTDKAATEAEKPETKLSLEFGSSLTSGNSVLFNGAGGLNGSYKWVNNRLSLTGGLTFATGKVDTDANGTLSEAERDAEFVPSARRYFGSLRYDRFVTGKNSFYALGGAFSDRFAGLDYRANVQIGYSRVLLDTEDTDIQTEIGVDFAREDYIDGIDPEILMFPSAKVFFGLSHNFNENVSFQDQLEAFENFTNFQDVRVYNTATLSVRLSEKVSLKLSNRIVFDNVPASLDFRKMDMTTQATLVASIF